MIRRKALIVSLSVIFSFTTFEGKSVAINSNVDGSWNSITTWDCGCIPGVGDDVTIFGHEINISGATLNVNSLAINSHPTSNTKLTISASSLTVLSNMTMDVDNHDTHVDIEISGSGQLIVTDNATFTRSTSNGFAKRMRLYLLNSGQFNVGGNFTFTYGDASNSEASDEILMENSSLLSVTGSMVFQQTSNGVNATLSAANSSAISIGSNFTMSHQDGDRVQVNLADNVIMSTGGDFLVHQGTTSPNEETELKLSNSAQLLVTGTFTIDQSLDNEDLFITLNDAGKIDVASSFIVDKSGGDDLTISLNGATSMLEALALDINATAGSSDKLIFDLNDGEVSVTNALTIDREADHGRVTFDLDGGNVTVGSLAITNSGVGTVGNERIELLIDGSSVFTSNGNSTINTTGGNDIRIDVNDNAGTDAQFIVNGSLDIDLDGGDDFHIKLHEDDSYVNVTGAFDITQTAGGIATIRLDKDSELDLDNTLSLSRTGGTSTEEIEILMGGETATAVDDPTFSVAGAFTVTNAGPADAGIDFELNGGTFSTGAVTINQNVGAEDVNIDLDSAAVWNVTGSFIVNQVGGDDLLIDLGNSSVGSTAELNISGALTINNQISSANNLMRIYVYDDTKLSVGTDLSITSSNAGADLILLSIDNTADVLVGGNINMTAQGSGDVEIRLRNDSRLELGGNFVRAASPNNFGELDCAIGNGTVEYNGSIAQIIAEDDGAGGDDFHYMNLEISNTLGIIPETTLEGDVTVHGNLILTEGAVSANGSILEIDNGATTAISKTDGYLYSEATNNSNKFQWNIGSTTGAHVWPFCDASGELIPFTLDLTGGTIGDVTLSTYPTVTNNTPLPSAPEVVLNVDASDGSGDNSANTIDRFWQIDKTGASGTSTIIFSYADTDVSSNVSSNETTLEAQRYDAATDVWQPAIAGQVTDAVNNTVTVVGVTDFSPWTLALNTRPLPVELITFDAKPAGNNVELNWQTATETNNDYFTIERSLNGIITEEVLILEGAGNSYSTINYNAIDEAPFIGLSYYRLKQTDFDGTTDYSDWVAVEFEKMNDFALNVFPNPVSGQEINLSLGSFTGKVQLNIYDIIGKQIYGSQLLLTGNEQVLRIEKPALMKEGVYLIQVKAGEKSIQRKLISK